MKAKLINPNGDESRICIKKIADINKLICQNKYDSEFDILFLSDNKMIIYDADFISKDLPINTIATEIAHQEDIILPSMNIGGDVLLMEYCDEFYEYL